MNNYSRKPIDITGQRFGTLVAIKVLQEKNKYNQRIWECLCDCGNITNILQQSLRQGNTKKCDDHPKNKYRIVNDYVELDVSVPSNPTAVSKIDPEDLERVINYKKNKNRLRWILHDSSPDYVWGNYVISTDRKERLHRFVLDLKDPTLVVDHINGDTLDNRKLNLRIINRAENNKNIRKRINNSSGYTGVYLNEKSGLYVASVQLNSKKLYLGKFDTLEQANIAYRTAIKVLGFSERHGL